LESELVALCDLLYNVSSGKTSILQIKLDKGIEIHMKKGIHIIIRVLLILIAVMVLSGIIVVICATQRDQAENVCQGVLRLSTTTKDTGIVANKALALLNDASADAEGRCSAVVKTLSNGDTVVGRNLDTSMNQYPVYIGTTDIEGFYKTVYATIMETLGPTYDSCVEKGVPKYMSALIPFVASDSLNSEGLYMEINMRMDQKAEDGNMVFSCSGTNTDAAVRLNACELPSYVTMRCKNTEEALALIKTLDIYTMCGDDSWTICFIIADAEGNYGLLELGCNEVRWLPLENIQTNFYISEDFNALQVYRQGLGRYEYLEENLEKVDSESDMLALMEGVKYSEIYNIDDPNYDIRSEFAGDEEYLTNDYLENDENWEAFLLTYTEEADYFYATDRKELEETNYFWISLYTTIVNCTQKTLSFSFYEEYNITYVLSFD